MFCSYLLLLGRETHDDFFEFLLFFVRSMPPCRIDVVVSPKVPSSVGHSAARLPHYFFRWSRPSLARHYIYGFFSYDVVDFDPCTDGKNTAYSPLLCSEIFGFWPESPFSSTHKLVVGRMQDPMIAVASNKRLLHYPSFFRSLSPVELLLHLTGPPKLS